MKNIEDFTRRKFINYSMVGGVALPLLSLMNCPNVAHGGVFQTAKDLENMTDLEQMHVPKFLYPQL